MRTIDLLIIHAILAVAMIALIVEGMSLII